MGGWARGVCACVSECYLFQINPETAGSCTTAMSRSLHCMLLLGALFRQKTLHFHLNILIKVNVIHSATHLFFPFTGHVIVCS